MLMHYFPPSLQIFSYPITAKYDLVLIWNFKSSCKIPVYVDDFKRPISHNELLLQIFNTLDHPSVCDFSLRLLPRAENT